MSFLEAVIGRTRTIESLLEGKYHGAGRGLHEKLSSVERGLDSKIVKQIRFIATVRNKLVHESNYSFDLNCHDFLRRCDEVIGYLHSAQPVPRPIFVAPHRAPSFAKTNVSRSSPAVLVAVIPFLVVLVAMILLIGFPNFIGSNKFPASNTNDNVSAGNRARDAETGIAKYQRVALDQKILDSYTGRYEYGSHTTEVSRSGDELFIDSPEVVGKFEPISTTEFLAGGVVKNVKSIKFVNNSRGKVTHMLITKEDGRKVRARKIK